MNAILEETLIKWNEQAIMKQWMSTRLCALI